MDTYRFEELSVEVPVQRIRNFDVVVKLQDYGDYKQTRDVVGTVSKILSKSPRLNSLTITIKFPPQSETASESAETGSESEALETGSDSEAPQSESGSESPNRPESYQILWPFACLLRKVQWVTINGIRSKYAKHLQEEMRGDKHPHQLDQQYRLYKEIVLGRVLDDLRDLDEFRQCWDSEGFLKCLKKSVQRVPDHLRSLMDIWPSYSYKFGDTNEILESLRTASVEEATIPGPRKRSRSL